MYGTVSLVRAARQPRLAANGTAGARRARMHEPAHAVRQAGIDHVPCAFDIHALDHPRVGVVAVERGDMEDSIATLDDTPQSGGVEQVGALRADVGAELGDVAADEAARARDVGLHVPPDRGTLSGHRPDDAIVVANEEVSAARSGEMLLLPVAAGEPAAHSH